MYSGTYHAFGMNFTGTMQVHAKKKKVDLMQTIFLLRTRSKRVFKKNIAMRKQYMQNISKSWKTEEFRRNFFLLKVIYQFVQKKKAGKKHTSPLE